MHMAQCFIGATRRAEKGHKHQTPAIKRGEECGAGEILLTSMGRDGTKDGFDCILTSNVSQSTNVPTIASGGVGTLEHFSQGVLEGKADALLAASVFHYGELTIRDVKDYLIAREISVRPA